MINLQVGCLIITLFMMGIYFSTKRVRTSGHIIFSCQLVLSVVYLLLDIATVYTVNRLIEVPAFINDLAHKLFLCSILCYLYLNIKYITILIDREMKVNLAWGVASVVAVLVSPVCYTESVHGNYASGPAVYILYATMFLYIVMCSYYLLRYWQMIDRKKRYIIILALGFQTAIMFYKLLCPYQYISCLGFVLIDLSFFLTVESPDILLIEQLKKEKERADEANQAKSSFLARMSHEIRTPIHVIAGMDEMILRETREDSVRDYAMDIRSATQTLLGLVNDILDLSKIESGKMTIIPVEYELSTVIRDLVNSVSELAEEKNLNLELEISPALPTTLFGDGTRLRQIILNLLTNAVKYTPEGTVFFRMSDRLDGEECVLTVEIEDTGIGIKEEDIPKLYEAFERIEEKRNRNIEGTGLGINITNELLGMMGSKLEVKSIYGKGSVFSFTLRQKVIDAEPIGNIGEYLRKQKKNYSYQASFAAHSARVLVVDDSPMNRKVFRNLLKQTGVQIEEAASGMECLEKVKSQHFHVIFMDHMMPNMDGIETFHRLRESEDHLCKNTPVVILTANAVEGAKEKYLKEGFDAFLKKPIVPYKLERTLQKLLPGELIEEETEYRDSRKEIVLPDIDGINYQYAKLYTNDAGMICDTLRDFYETMGQAKEELQYYYARISEEEYLEKFRIRVHSLKSNAALTGILSVSELARLLEYAARDGDLQKVDRLMPVLCDELDTYRDRLGTLFQVNEKPTLTDKSELLAWLEMLRVSMLSMDMDTGDMVSEKLDAYTYEKPLADKISELLRYVAEMQTEKAAQAAEALIEEMTRDGKEEA